MPAVTRDILIDFSEEVRKILGKSLRKIILYGSYARGDYTENSDIDLMILTTLTDKEIERIEEKIYDLAFDFSHGLWRGHQRCYKERGAVQLLAWSITVLQQCAEGRCGLKWIIGRKN